MIISASRRTDIPAFHTEWMMQSIRDGFCCVANPFNSKQVSRVSLSPEDVDVIVFWTRNPLPLLPHLDELDSRGFRYYFLYTITGYPTQLEPNAPALDDAVRTFRLLSDRISPDKVIWRYDPIIFTSLAPHTFHIDNFSRIAGLLEGCTNRVIISIFDEYRGAMARLKACGLVPANRSEIAEQLPEMFRTITEMANHHGLQISGCAEDFDLTQYGIKRGKCIDDGYIRRVFGIDIAHRKDKSQRPRCSCIQSKDIGTYNTCSYGCLYCYARR